MGCEKYKVQTTARLFKMLLKYVLYLTVFLHLFSTASTIESVFNVGNFFVRNTDSFWTFITYVEAFCSNNAQNR